MTQELGDTKNIPEDVLNQLGDRYSEYEYISSGATSTVYKANDNILGKIVALKILKHPDQKVLIRFQQEARALSLLVHKNLVQILDFNVTKQNHAYLIMEYINGEDLSSAIESYGRLSIEQALDIALQICDGMSHAHSKNIVHRDLKTSNIIVDNLDNPKITIVDFGLAVKQAQDDTVVQDTRDGLSTTSGKVQGSPLYMSPEQANGKEAGHRSDIYSLGCILFKLLTGDTPFNSDELMDLLRKHISQSPPKLSEVDSSLELPDGLEDVVEKMLAKNPNSRYQSMPQVKDAILELGKEAVEIDDTEFSTKGKQNNFLIYGLLLLVVGVAGFVIMNILSPKDFNSGTKEHKLTRLEILRNGFSLSRNTNHDEHDQNLWYGPSISLTKELKDEDLKILATLIEEQKENRIAIRKEQQLHRKENKNNPDFKLKEKPIYTDSLNLLETHITGEGLKYLVDSGIKRLDLSKTTLSPVAFEYLAQMPKLHRLILDFSTLDDSGLQKLWQSRSLIDLRLKNSKGITDDALIGIEECSNLQNINLGNKSTSLSIGKTTPDITINKNITDKSFGYMARSRSIRKIIAVGTSVTDKGIETILDAPFRKSNQLLEFQMDYCRGITGKTISLLVNKNPKTKYLGVSFTSVTPQDLILIKPLTNLTTLNVASIDIGPEQLDAIGNLHHLKFLYMTKMTGNDQDIQKLSKLNKLRSLLMYETPNLTNTGFDAFKKHFGEKTLIMCPKFAPTSIKSHESFLKESEQFELD